MGTADRVGSGTTFLRLGTIGQGPGKIATAMAWNRILSRDEIRDVFLISVILLRVLRVHVLRRFAALGLLGTNLFLVGVHLFFLTS